MRNFSYLTCLLMIFSSFVNAQDIAWEINDLSKKAWINQTDDGNILIEDNKVISSYNLDGKKLWSTEGISKVGSVALMNDLPYITNTGSTYNLIESTSGKMLSSHNKKTSVAATYKYWDLAKVVFSLNVDGKDVIEILDLNTNELFSVQVSEKIDKGGFLSSYRAPKPSFNGDNLVVYRKKSMYFINSKTGQITKEVVFKKDYKLLGQGSENRVSLLSWDKKMIKAFDNGTGEMLWEQKQNEKKPNVHFLGENKENALIVEKKKYKIINVADQRELANGKWKDEPKFIKMYEGKLMAGMKKDLLELSPTDLSVISTTSLDHDVINLQKVNGLDILSTYRQNNIINLKDMSLRYKYKNEINSESVFDILEIGADHLFITKSQDKFTYQLINRDGKQIWDQSFTSAELPSFDIIGDNALVISDVQVTLISLATGKTVWGKKKISIKPGFAYAYNSRLEKLAYYNDKKVGLIDMTNGEWAPFKEKVKFKDFNAEEQTPTVALLDEGIYLKGSNSIAFYDLEGTLKYNNHYKKSDNTAGLMKLANFAVTAGTIASGNAGKVLTVTNADTGDVIHKGSMVDGLNDNIDYANDLAEKRRRLANKGSVSIPFVFTKQKSGDRGLIFFEPVSGEERYSITMKEKEPNYILDEYAKKLIYLDTKSKKLLVYDLK